ncbi:MAG: trehalase family glycosidase [Bacteroidales bacterium]|nr:trehalase family glycosidase [Bacteroidales bacterium]
MQRIILFSFILIISSSIYSQTEINNFKNHITCNYFSDSPYNEPEFYTSRGSWFGFTIPDSLNKNNFGKFGGPYCIKTQKWISKSLLEFDYGISGKGVISLSDSDEYEISQLPGMLYQKYVFPNIKIELKLSFISNRTCLYQALLINTSNKEQDVSMRLKGTAFEELGKAENFSDGWMFKIDGKDDIFWLLRFRIDKDMEIMYTETDYEISYKDLLKLNSGDTLKLIATFSQYFKGDSKQDVMVASDALENPDNYLINNSKYWDAIYNAINTDNQNYKNLCLKSIQTLYNNLRSPLPYYSNYFFYRGKGIENSITDVEESWLIASSLIKFDTRLAMHQLASVLVSMNPDSSINRFLSFNPNNEMSSAINQKPMAAWTCWNIFSVSKDLDFLIQAFPLIEAYHNYWYTKNDKNGNLWCEDNEGIETVELNALLYTEKYCLEKMSKIIGDTAKSITYQNQIEDIQNNFNKYFYNNSLKKYCDHSLTSDTIIISNSAPGYCLWSGLSSIEIATEYAKQVDQMINSGYYLSLLKSEKYNVDYFYFLISGLKLYGFNGISEYLKSELINVYINQNANLSLKYYDNEKNSYIENSSMTAAVILLLVNY